MTNNKIIIERRCKEIREDTEDWFLQGVALIIEKYNWKKDTKIPKKPEQAIETIEKLKKILSDYDK